MAKEIGSNDGYQKYLVSIKTLEVEQIVWYEKAKALQSADIKMIVNSGDANTGLNKITDVLSSKGGTNMGSMLEGLAQTEMGKTLLSKFLPVKE